MATPAQRRAIGDLQRARAAHAEAERGLSAVLAEIATASEPHDVEELEGLREQFLELRDAAAASLEQIKVPALGKGAGFELLSARHPLLLLPVRLETRFAWSNGAGGQTFTKDPNADVSLLIRVFPDEIHEDSHEPELTGAELVVLKELDQRLKAARDLKDLDAAWGDVIRRVGPTRAGWLGEVLARGAPPGRRPAAYSRPSVARLLPERWVAVAELGDGSVEAATADFPVREPLETVPTAAGGEWMTDFGPMPYGPHSILWWSLSSYGLFGAVFRCAFLMYLPFAILRLKVQDWRRHEAVSYPTALILSAAGFFFDDGHIVYPYLMTIWFIFLLLLIRRRHASPIRRGPR